MEEFSLLSVRKAEDSRIKDPHTAESSGHVCSETQNNKSSLRFKPPFCSENALRRAVKHFCSHSHQLRKHPSNLPTETSSARPVKQTANKEWWSYFGWKNHTLKTSLWQSIWFVCLKVTQFFFLFPEDQKHINLGIKQNRNLPEHPSLLQVWEVLAEVNQAWRQPWRKARRIRDKFSKQCSQVSWTVWMNSLEQSFCFKLLLN